MWTFYNVYGLHEAAKKMMAKYLKDGGKTFADCKQCGLCEKKCPQRLKIRENLEKVCKILCE
jgi:predicted aldo/keto reductase-like oxidoreductase